MDSVTSHRSAFFIQVQAIVFAYGNAQNVQNVLEFLGIKVHQYSTSSENPDKRC